MLFLLQEPLLGSLEEYSLVRQHKEEEKKRSRVGFLLFKFRNLHYSSCVILSNLSRINIVEVRSIS